MIRQPGLLSYLSKERRNATWQLLGICEHIYLAGKWGAHSGFPLGSALCQGPFESLASDVSFEAISFHSAVTTAGVPGALESSPHGGSISHGESLSTARLGHIRVEHAPHISLPSSGVWQPLGCPGLSWDLRDHSQVKFWKILFAWNHKQAILSHFWLKIKSVALVKSICLSQWDIPCSKGPVLLSFLWLTLPAPWLTLKAP